MKSYRIGDIIEIKDITEMEFKDEQEEEHYKAFVSYSDNSLKIFTRKEPNKSRTFVIADIFDSYKIIAGIPVVPIAETTSEGYPTILDCHQTGKSYQAAQMQVNFRENWIKGKIGFVSNAES